MYSKEIRKVLSNKTVMTTNLHVNHSMHEIDLYESKSNITDMNEKIRVQNGIRFACDEVSHLLTFMHSNIKVSLVLFVTICNTFEKQTQSRTSKVSCAIHEANKSKCTMTARANYVHFEPNDVCKITRTLLRCPAWHL